MYCAHCGTQNAETSKFCFKCGKTLVNTSLQPPSSLPGQFPAHSAPANAPADPVATAALYGGIGGLAGGALSIIGWLMPWSNAVIVSISGLQITLTSITGGFAGLGTLQYGNSGVVIVCLGIFFALVFGAIPVLGALCLRSGLATFELKSSARSMYQIQGELNRLRSRSIKGAVLMTLIFLVPLVLSALLSAALPGLFVLGQLGNLLPNSGYGSGFFVSASGFVLAYIGTRLAQSQISGSTAAGSVKT